MLQKSEEVWEFPITPELRKSCKLAYSRKLQDNEIKKVEKEKSEKNLKRQQREELEVVKTTQIHNYNTRSKFIIRDQLINTKNLFTHTARTSHYGLEKIKIQGAKLWNELPSDKSNYFFWSL